MTMSPKFFCAGDMSVDTENVGDNVGYCRRQKLLSDQHVGPILSPIKAENVSTALLLLSRGLSALQSVQCTLRDTIFFTPIVQI